MRNFQSVNAAQFAAIVRDYPWTRRITEIHLHHTWRPRQKDYVGLRTIESMWRFHTEANKWSDLAQHVSIAPDGTIWIGRNFNWAPASAPGFNGNSQAGPFMIEMIGDFDDNRDSLGAEQKTACLAVIKSIQQKFGLKPDHLRFHNEMSSKSCPGGAMDKVAWVSDVAQFEPQLSSRAGGGTAFSEQATSSYEIIESMRPEARQTDDMSGAEHNPEPLPPSEGLGARGLVPRGVSTEILEELSDHIINLTQGRFSTGGLVSSDETDVDRIINERLSVEIANAKKASAGGRNDKARLLIYAHGGLVSEQTALLAAYDQLRFWRDNGVYPLFFIWETGLAETLKQMLSGTRALTDAPRGAVSDWLDERVEEVVRLAGADKVWSGMKRSAELASGPKGGAAYAAQQISRLLADRGDDIEVHIVGHSAGSIFLTQFLSALEKNVRVKTAHFLAPAITNELFLEEFAPELGKKVESLTIFTMKKVRELADTVTPLYRKSLLYLIYHALEAKRGTDILGLELSLRRDPGTRALLGLDGRGERKMEVIWSPSTEIGSGSASNSTTHGGFDNDAPTLESVCRRILGRVNGETIAPYTPRAISRSVWDDDAQWPGFQPVVAAKSATTTSLASSAGKTAPVQKMSGGKRLALCFGIDNYPHISPLRGCINDSKNWSAMLRGLGYEVTSVPEQEATADNIRHRLREFIASADPSDRLVVQYAGHGTRFDDVSGDEGGQDDSALCAFDCGNPSGDGGLVLDDEIYEISKRLPEGASLTFFFDCCHSGTMARVAPVLGGPHEDIRARGIAPTPAMESAYQKMRGSRLGARSAGPAKERSIGIQFSACQDDEFAFEMNGAGHFTTLATKIIPQARGLTNQALHDKLKAAFGASRRQTPNLYGDRTLFDQPLNLF